MDTYDIHGNFQQELHLHIGKQDNNYTDMVIIINAKEDVNDEADLCTTFIVFLVGENNKAANIFLKMESRIPSDMKGSKDRKGQVTNKVKNEYIQL